MKYDITIALIFLRLLCHTRAVDEFPNFLLDCVLVQSLTISCEFTTRPERMLALRESSAYSCIDLARVTSRHIRPPPKLCYNLRPSSSSDFRSGYPFAFARSIDERENFRSAFGRRPAAADPCFSGLIRATRDVIPRREVTARR